MMDILKQINKVVHVFNIQISLECHSSCDTCKNVNTHCLTCKSDSKRILTNNQCICLDGYYDTGIELC